MFCPNCGTEYRPGFTECADCHVALVAGPPPPVDPVGTPIEFVTVLRTGEPFTIGMARSRLEEVGIVHVVVGEGLQELFAGGRLGTGFNPLVGPVEIRVDRKREQEALELIADLDPSTTEED